MAYVVTSACFGCRHTECVEDCPTESFHEGEQMLFIDPETCIHCDACALVCPENAIYPDDQVPEDQLEFIELNREMSAKLPAIMEKKTPLS